MFSQIIKDEKKAKEYHDYIIKKYSNGQLAERDLNTEFYNEKSSPQKMENLLDSFHKNFPNSDNYAYMAGYVLETYCNQEKFTEAREFVKKLNVLEDTNDKNTLDIW